MLSSSTPPGNILDRVADWIDENVQPFGLVVTIVGGLVLYLAAVAWGWSHTSYDVWGALLIAPLLIALTVPLARRAAYDLHDPTMVRLLIGALITKMFMTLARYAVAFGVYGGQADAAVYHQFGRDLSHRFRSGDFHTMGQPLSGTGFIRIFTGVVYTITGPTKIGGFLVYSWLGFWGLYFFYRAFRLAFPDGDHRRYAYFLFFLPSMLFWPSSIGKEAWMCLMLGMCCYGAAKLFTRRRGGFPVMAIGVVGCAFVRPHVGLLFFVGMGMAYLLRRAQKRRVLGAIPKLLGCVVLIVGGIFLLDRVEQYFGVANVSEGGATQALSIAQSRTDEGGSSFKTVTPTSPTRFAYSTITVLFRPFPYEAGNFQSLLASVEGLVLLGYAFFSIPRALRLFTHLRSWPYAVLSLTYVLLFCYAFSSIGNFGILTRQRVQVMPFLLVLLCLPRAPEPGLEVADANG